MMALPDVNPKDDDDDDGDAAYDHVFERGPWKNYGYHC